MTAKRLAEGGRIDRGRTLRFTWDGGALAGLAGDTLASALLANGVRIVGRSFKYHRPRGLYGAWVEEPNAIVDVQHGEVQEPDARATTVELREGLAARGVNARPDVAHDRYGALDLLHPFLPAGFYYKAFFPDWHRYEPRIRAMAGLGRVATAPDSRRFQALTAHCDVLVVGGGPAGLAAARAAGESGLSVILADDRSAPGGSLLWQNATINGENGDRWADAVSASLGRGNVRIFARSTVFGAYDHGTWGMVERRSDAPAGWAGERLWTIRARRTVLATGAIERPLVFPDNDRPGVMSADAVMQYLRLYGVRAGEQAVVATNNDSAYAVALALRAAGAAVMVADLRPDLPPAAEAAITAGIRVLPGAVPLRAIGRDGVRLVDLGPQDATSPREAVMRVPADLLAVSGGWSPSLHLLSQARGSLRWDDGRAAFLPDRCPPDLHVIAAESIAAALVEGHAAGTDAAAALGARVTIAAPHCEPDPPATPIRAHWRVPIRRARQWVDLQNDVTSKDIVLAARENYSSVEHLKRYTTLGMATDQGKTSNVNGLAILAETTGRAIPEVGTTTFRPPYTPVPFGALAGLRHGRLFSPWRRLPAHRDHAALGAEFREYGGWMRPACYPRAGETAAQAIRREAAATRAGVGLFDASSLGKIVVGGPDAAAFLNIVYYNEVANLKPGRIRYALLLRETGIIYDDGVVTRLAPDRYLLSPSSSHTQGVLAMLEAWRQTECPAMRVAFHDVTAAWCTFAIAGPRARDVLARLTDIDLSDTVLPHMAIAQGGIAGIHGRVARVSFSGERSYEVSLPAGYGPALLQRLLTEGTPHGITPYGVETSSLLRAEKGYILIGVDTDGMTLPGDIGMSGPLRAKPVDFVGKRSLLMPDALREDRRQFVGLLPDDPAAPPAVGAHAVEHTADGQRRSIGWITTSVHSPALGRGIALGMIERGRARAAAGETVELYHLGHLSRARLCSPVFFDPAGERLHG